MAIEPLSALPAGSDVFIDANIFVCGLSRQSNECYDFLHRCAREEITGVTSFDVLSEATHKLMIAEAVATHQIPKPDWKLLRSKPFIVRQLRRYWNQVETILNLNFLVLNAEKSTFQHGQAMRELYGLLTTDSLVMAIMEEYGLEFLASNDSDFKSIPTVTLYRPTDLSIHP